MDLNNKTEEELQQYFDKEFQELLDNSDNPQDLIDLQNEINRLKSQGSHLDNAKKLSELSQISLSSLKKETEKLIKKLGE